MYAIQVKARPKRQSDHFKTARGAFVNVWIDFKDSRGALVLALAYIKNEQWLPITAPKICEYKSIKKVPAAERSYFVEAVKYGFSMVFHCWPKKKAKKAKKSRTNGGTVRRYARRRCAGTLANETER